MPCFLRTLFVCFLIDRPCAVDWLVVFVVCTISKAGRTRRRFLCLIGCSLLHIIRLVASISPVCTCGYTHNVTLTIYLTHIWGSGGHCSGQGLRHVITICILLADTHKKGSSFNRHVDRLHLPALIEWRDQRGLRTTISKVQDFR